MVSCAAARVRHASAVATAISYSVRFEAGLGFGLERARHGHVGAAKSEIEGLPTDEHSERAAPRGVEIVGAEHGAGHGGNRALGQEESVDVVPGGAIDLGERVGAGQIGGARQANAGCRGVDLFLGDAHGRIILERALDGLADGQGRGSGSCWAMASPRAARRAPKTGDRRNVFQFSLRYSPSMSSRNSSRTLALEASNALRPRAVAR